MKKSSKHIFNLVAAVMILAWLPSCSNDLLLFPGEDETVMFSDDGDLIVSPIFDIPGMKKIGETRSLSGKPDYENLHLFMLVFEEGKGLRQYEEIKTVANQEDLQHNHVELVTVDGDIELQPTENNAVVHLIATNQPDFGKSIGFGTEERVITSLYTNEGYEAYWKRLDLGCNIPGAEMADPSYPGYQPAEKEKAEGIRAKFRHIPMVRNFCRVSINTDNVSDHFLLTGLYVVNTVNCGSVAPYVASNEAGNRFIEYFKENSSSYVSRNYEEISALNHIGTLPVGVKLINNSTKPEEIETKSESSTGAIDPVYFYERPARINSTERTYVILLGNITVKQIPFTRLTLET